MNSKKLFLLDEIEGRFFFFDTGSGGFGASFNF